MIVIDIEYRNMIMRLTLLFLACFLMTTAAFAEGIISDLRSEIENLQQGEMVLLEYTFEGCYGPYHHGSITIEMKNDKLEYLTKSYDHRNKEGISQAGSYERQQLVQLLNKAEDQTSSEVFGNAISYRLSDGHGELYSGADRIEQRHFISLFEPFTSIIPKEQKDIVPKISSGGFVH